MVSLILPLEGRLLGIRVPYRLLYAHLGFVALEAQLIVTEHLLSRVTSQRNGLCRRVGLTSTFTSNLQQGAMDSVLSDLPFYTLPYMAT